MKLTKEQKTVEMFNTLRAINDESFEGIENPPEYEFRMRFDRGDVFVLKAKEENPFSDYITAAYAIVNTDSPDAHLWQIATMPSHRGLGFAVILLKEIAEEYRGKKYDITLQVKVDNVDAQVLYLKNGYRVEAVLYGYFGPEKNGLFMRRELNGKS